MTWFRFSSGIPAVVEASSRQSLGSASEQWQSPQGRESPASFIMCVRCVFLCKRDRKTLAEYSCLPSSSCALWVASSSIACVTLTSRLCSSSWTSIMRANCCRRRDGYRCKVILLEQSLCACVCAHLCIYILIYAGWYFKNQNTHTHEHTQLVPCDGRWRCRTLETFRCPHEGRMPALQGLQNNQGFQKYCWTDSVTDRSKS